MRRTRNFTNLCLSRCLTNCWWSSLYYGVVQNSIHLLQFGPSHLVASVCFTSPVSGKESGRRKWHIEPSRAGIHSNQTQTGATAATRGHLSLSLYHGHHWHHSGQFLRFFVVSSSHFCLFKSLNFRRLHSYKEEVLAVFGRDIGYVLNAANCITVGREIAPPNQQDRGLLQLPQCSHEPNFVSLTLVPGRPP